MNKTLIPYIFILAFAYNSCDYNEIREKSQMYDSLLQKQQSDSLLLERFSKEMDQVNRVLDSVNILDEELKSNDTISKLGAIDKINFIDSLLEGRAKKIDSLNNEIAVLKSQFAKRVAVTRINEGKDQIEVRKRYYQELKKEIEELKEENFNLRDIIKRKDSLLLEKDRKIAAIQEEIENQLNKLDEQQRKLDEVNLDLLSAQVELTDLTNATAETYFKLANELKEISDRTSGVFNKKKKENLIKLAYNYFKKAAAMGYAPAENELEIILSDKKYQKFLTNN